MKRFKKQTGFTLIEVIVVLIILGIVAVVMSNTIVQGVQGYIFARNADQSSQKAQMAMARINKELIDATAVSVADANQIDYTLTRNKIPSCPVELPGGCQYSIKLTGASITLEGTNPVIGPQVLIDGVTAGNGGNNFLSYFQSDGTNWTIANGFKDLATIRVRISLDAVGNGNSLNFQGTINPRGNTILNAPQA